jgi:hypothetical protein
LSIEGKRGWATPLRFGGCGPYVKFTLTGKGCSVTEKNEPRGSISIQRPPADIHPQAAENALSTMQELELRLISSVGRL